MIHHSASACNPGKIPCLNRLKEDGLGLNSRFFITPSKLFGKWMKLIIDAKKCINYMKLNIMWWRSKQHAWWPIIQSDLQYTLCHKIQKFVHTRMLLAFRIKTTSKIITMWRTKMCRSTEQKYVQTEYRTFTECQKMIFVGQHGMAQANFWQIFRPLKHW